MGQSEKQAPYSHESKETLVAAILEELDTPGVRIGTELRLRIDALMALLKVDRAPHVQVQESVAWRAKDANGRWMYGNLPAPELPVDQPEFLTLNTAPFVDVNSLLETAYERGWIACASWAKRDDLCADIGSPAYIADRTQHLGSPCKLSL